MHILHMHIYSYISTSYTCTSRLDIRRVGGDANRIPHAGIRTQTMQQKRHLFSTVSPPPTPTQRPLPPCGGCPLCLPFWSTFFLGGGGDFFYIVVRTPPDRFRPRNVFCLCVYTLYLGMQSIDLTAFPRTDIRKVHTSTQLHTRVYIHAYIHSHEQISPAERVCM